MRGLPPSALTGDSAFVGAYENIEEANDFAAETIVGGGGTEPKNVTRRMTGRGCKSPSFFLDGPRITHLMGNSMVSQGQVESFCGGKFIMPSSTELARSLVRRKMGESPPCLCDFFRIFMAFRFNDRTALMPVITRQGALPQPIYQNKSSPPSLVNPPPPRSLTPDAPNLLPSDWYHNLPSPHDRFKLSRL